VTKDRWAKDALSRKYDRIAAEYSSRYADPDAIARHQVSLVEQWGARLEAGATVLEIGCADGLVTKALARSGMAVTAIDFSPVMVETARRRLNAAGLAANFVVTDLDSLDLGRQFDVVLAVMWSFFAYASDPRGAITRLADHTRVKMLIDANPRAFSIPSMVASVRAAGFESVAWRPFLIPQRRRLPRPVLRVLATTERVPGVRSLPLRSRCNIILKGEHRDHR